MLNYYGVDKKIVDESIINNFTFSENDLKLKRNADGDEYLVFDFVGFVFNSDKTLTVLPNDFIDQNEISELNEENQESKNLKRTLSDAIFLYLQSKESKAQASSYIGEEIGFESNYPFLEFFNIYKYYITRGLYREEQHITKTGISGKISWKDTINKSNVIISDGNLILYPLYSWTRTHIDVFISECMAFVINFTSNKFSFIFDIKPVQGLHPSNFLENLDYVISNLYQYKTKVFKDIYLKLINDLINFFSQLQKLENQGGNTHIKIKYFHYIWQEMVKKYLSDYIENVDKVSGVSFSQNKVNLVDFQEHVLEIDNSPNEFSLEFDHYAELNDSILIFDSKYYEDITDLDYKQYTYTQIEMNRLKARDIDKTIYSSLVIPTYQNNYEETFLKLKDEFLGNLTNPVMTKLYLNIRKLTENYISSE